MHFCVSLTGNGIMENNINVRTGHERLEQFNRIKARYREFERELLSQGKLPMRSTNTGFWGTADLEAVFHLFEALHLEKDKGFLDLGSGDGRIVLVAELFTQAQGVESDPELVDQSEEIRQELGLKADFVCTDFLSLDLSKFDFFFINPDHRFEEAFEDKLLQEARGKRLFVYNIVFAPEKLKKGKTYWHDQIPITEYMIEPK